MTEVNAKQDGEFWLLNPVRVSFPYPKKRPVVNGEPGKFGARLMLSKAEDMGAVDAMQAHIGKLIAEKFRGKNVAIPPHKRALRDGDEEPRQEYAGHWILSANSDQPVVVLAPGTTTPVEDEGGIYSGCYVAAKVRFWVQDNQYGKRVNAALVAIRFEADGEAFSGAYVPPEVAASGFEVDAADAFM